MRAAFIVALVCAACDTPTVDLGSNRILVAASDASDANAPSDAPARECPVLTEAELVTLRGSATCSSTCGGEPSPVRSVSSAKELVATFEGQWLLCAGSGPWPSDVAGIEFDPGCIVFLLTEDDNGNLVRVADVAHQATFDVLSTSSGYVLALNLASGELDVDVVTSDCPNRLRLTSSEVTLDFCAPANRPPPAK
jgi:hypothetical protein